MIKRTLYFGNPAYLHKQLKQLKVIKPETNVEIGSVPLEDIAAVSYTHLTLPTTPYV